MCCIICQEVKQGPNSEEEEKIICSNVNIGKNKKSQHSQEVPEGSRTPDKVKKSNLKQDCQNNCLKIGTHTMIIYTNHYINGFKFEGLCLVTLQLLTQRLHKVCACFFYKHQYFSAQPQTDA